VRVVSAELQLNVDQPSSLNVLLVALRQIIAKRDRPLSSPRDFCPVYVISRKTDRVRLSISSKVGADNHSYPTNILLRCISEQ